MYEYMKHFYEIIIIGYLLIRKYGHWGKLCTENFEKVVTNSHASWQISDLGRAVCKTMTYQ